MIGGEVDLTANVDDSTTGGSNIAEAAYILNLVNLSDPPMFPQDGDFDEVSEDVTATFTAPGTPGIYGVTVVGVDMLGNVGNPEVGMLAVYDPSDGFVTGGGWIDSPVKDYQYMTVGGKANFGFVSKYNKGKNVPDGSTNFVFQAGDLHFHSSSYDWLLVTGSNYAKFKGTGTINGSGEYKFQIWAGDSTPDTFRIKIWYEDSSEVVVYDNVNDQAIGGGSIIVHTSKK